MMSHLHKHLRQRRCLGVTATESYEKLDASERVLTEGHVVTEAISVIVAKFAHIEQVLVNLKDVGTHLS